MSVSAGDGGEVIALSSRAPEPAPHEHAGRHTVLALNVARSLHQLPHSLAMGETLLSLAQY